MQKRLLQRTQTAGNCSCDLMKSEFARGYEGHDFF